MSIVRQLNSMDSYLGTNLFNGCTEWLQIAIAATEFELGWERHEERRFELSLNERFALEKYYDERAEYSYDQWISERESQG